MRQAKLQLGCGRRLYTVGLWRLAPEASGILQHDGSVEEIYGLTVSRSQAIWSANYLPSRQSITGNIGLKAHGRSSPVRSKRI